MSYELAGLPARKPVRRFVTGSRLPAPGAIGSIKRRTHPGELAETLPRLPSNYTLASDLTGLGFSLKPPKWLRKMQPGKILKKAIVPAAIIGGSLLIPGVGGVVAKGLTSAAKGAVGLAKLGFGVGKGAVKLAGKGASGLTKGIGRLFSSKIVAGTVGEKIAQTSIGGAGSLLTSMITGGGAQAGPTTTESVPSTPVSQQDPGWAASYPSYGPADYGSAASGGGGYSAPAVAAESAAPAQAGMDGSTLMMIGVGVLALVAVTGALKRR